MKKIIKNNINFNFIYICCFNLNEYYICRSNRKKSLENDIKNYQEKNW